MKYFFVYILRCSDGSYYVGHADNLEKRIWEHRLKKYDGYTSARLPIVLVFAQTFTSRDEARAAEFKIKKWTRKKKEALIKQDWNEISLLAKKQFEGKKNTKK